MSSQRRGNAHRSGSAMPRATPSQLDHGVADPTRFLRLADRLDLQQVAARLPDGALAELRSLSVHVSNERRRGNEGPIADLALRWSRNARRVGARRDVRVVVASTVFDVAKPFPAGPPSARAPRPDRALVIQRHAQVDANLHDRVLAKRVSAYFAALRPKPTRRVREETPRRDNRLAAVEARLAAAQARALRYAIAAEREALRRGAP